MKILRPTLAFLGSAAVGFASMTAYRSFKSTPSTPDKASALSPAIPSASTAPASNTPEHDPLPGSPDNPATADQWRAFLTIFGIPLEWAEVLAAPDTSNFPEWSAKLEKMTNNDSRSLLQELFYGRWASLDPAGAVAFLKSAKNESGLNHLFSQWAILDPIPALAAAETLGLNHRNVALCSLAIDSPARFFKWAREHAEINPFLFPVGKEANGAAAYQSLIDTDPNQVLAWTKLHPESHWSEKVAGQLATALAKRNLDEALAWAASIAAPGSREEAQMAIAGVMANTDPEKALELFSSIARDREDLITYNLALLDKLGTAAPDKLMAAAFSMSDGPLRGSVITTALGKLLLRNPTQAFALADSIGLAALPAEAYRSPPEIQNTDQARQILEAAQAGDLTVFRQRAASQAISTLLERDQPGLASLLAGKIDLPFFAGLKLQETIAGTGRTLDPALAEVLGIRTEHEIAALAERDPAAAAANLERISDPQARAATIGKIAQSWLQEDQSDAIAWAYNLANPTDQTAAWKTLTGAWLEDDPQRASAWVKNLPPGAPKDATVVVLVDHISKKDPDLAWQWAGTLTDSSQKMQALGKAALAWQQTDPTALQAALNAGNILPAERASVLKQIQGKP